MFLGLCFLSLAFERVVVRCEGLIVVRGVEYIVGFGKSFLYCN